jgi:predicted DNA-binding protein
MDFDAFAVDLKKEAVKLPVELVEVLQKLAEHFGPALETLVPAMIANLKEHVEVILMEGAVGMLDKRKLEQVIGATLKEVLTNGQASRSAG